MENNRKSKIFLVDDDPFCLSMYEQHLVNLGYSNIIAFDNGTDCLNSITDNPEIIFLDHNMDVLNGFELLKKIKRYNPNIFVVMISGQENMKTAIDALKYGAFDYLIKGDQEEEKMADVLSRISNIKTQLQMSKFSLLRKLLTLV
jgi:DNA-binding NtrC family response regulator